MYPRNCFSCDGRRNSGSNGNTGSTGLFDATGPSGITANAVYSIFLVTNI